MNRLSFMLALGLCTLIFAPTVQAQAPTEAQQKALRANCVSDFRKHCSGVPTGGMDALVCLKKNVDSLSPACKSAVEAVDPAAAPSSSASAPAAAPKPETASAPTATPSQSETTSAPPPAAIPQAGSAEHEPQLTFRQEMAIAAGACAIDFRLFCPNLPVGHGNVLFCLRVHGPRLAPACREALVKAGVPVR